MKKIILIALLLMCPVAALASSGTNYESNPEALIPGGTADGTNYKTQNAVGDNAIGTTSGSTYSTTLGFFGTGVTAAPTDEVGAPVISYLRFDGQDLLDGDYANSDVTITAIVTGGATDLDVNASSIEVDANLFSFSNLPGDSTYEALSGLLTYKRPNPFSDGDHTFRIIARNVVGKTSNEARSFKVESGKAKVIGKVLSYPNPFNPEDPAQGTAVISYNLSKDADVSLYLFNCIGQLIYKRDYSSGQTGGQAGYNEVTWDGKSDFGQIAGNDIYFWRVVSNGKVIGRGKIAVIK